MKRAIQLGVITRLGIAATLTLLNPDCRAQDPERLGTLAPLLIGVESDSTDGTGSAAIEGFIAAPARSPKRDWSSLSAQKRVDWTNLGNQTGLFLGIQHSIRLVTEPGTREGMKGPFFKNYYRSLTNLHGWADGDEFYVNWVGHPMEGAVAGYLFNQNDVPEYRYAEFGKDRAYWKSRLRSLAWAYAFSLQFEIGPLSEASIGSIQSKHPQQGFVDHVITPAVGMGWMLGEDVLDKYVVQRLESHLSNPIAIMMVRGWLNPARSFSNMLRFKVPWQRDTRRDLFGAETRAETIQAFLANARETRKPVAPERAHAVLAPFQFELGVQSTRYSSGQCVGAAGMSAFRLANRLQAVLDVGGCKLTGLATNTSGDSLHYVAGIRWTAFSRGKWSVHGQVLGGGEKITRELMLPNEKARLYSAWARSGSDPKNEPTHDQYTRSSETNGPSIQGGAGMSYRINSALQLKIANVDWRQSWLGPVDSFNYSRSINFSSGLTLRMGTW